MDGLFSKADISPTKSLLLSMGRHFLSALCKTEKKLKVDFVDIEFAGQDEVSAGGDSGER